MAMAPGLEAIKAAEEATATDIQTGTKIMADADMALKTTIPMGKPKGVAAKAASVTSKTFICPFTSIPFRHMLTTI